MPLPAYLEDVLLERDGQLRTVADYLADAAGGHGLSSSRVRPM
jgi:hypothetical protein